MNLKDKNSLVGILILISFLLTTSLGSQEYIIHPHCKFEFPQSACVDATFKLEFLSTGTAVFDIEEFEKGETIELLISLEITNEKIRSLTFGLEHDPEILSIFSMKLCESANGESIEDRLTSSAVEDTTKTGLIYLAFERSQSPLPSGSLSLVKVVYKVHERPSQKGSTLRFVNHLIITEGAPPTPTNFTIGTSTRIPRLLHTARVISSHPTFLRGDANSDSIVNLDDTIFMLEFLFLGGKIPQCFKAFDSDANETINITDPIRVYQTLFFGQPIPSPFPICGTEKVEKLGCEIYQDC